MPTSLEVRWFHSGAVPSSVQDWFDGHDPDTPSTWTDLYLPSADAGLNVKVRDDKFQIKRRLAGPAVHTFGPTASGHVEQWTKWSFDLATDSPHVGDQPGADYWISVEKTRRQRTFDPDELSPLGVDLPTSTPASVLFELTTLATLDLAAWTLCLEAEGPPKSLTQTLYQAGAELLDSTLTVQLHPDNSYGYVRWLQQQSDLPGRAAGDGEIRLQE